MTFPPFTERWVLSGPRTAVSCDVDYDRENEEYHATSSAGFHGAGQSEEEAVLALFTAWLTLKRGWHVPEATETEET